ncbi:MAG: AAA family ATPase [Spirochaetia bacterium]
MKKLIIYVTGFRQHAGKTVTSLGLISMLKKVVPAEEIGYIKPVGQELIKLPDGSKIDKDAVIIDKFSDIPDLDLGNVSPVRLGSGFTKEFLKKENKKEETKTLTDSILHSLKAMEEKRVIVAEGTGHPGVGGIVGLSNAIVGNIMNADIIFLSGGGIGRALDQLEVDLSYFMYRQSNVRGIIFNKCFPEKIETMKKYITEDLLNKKYLGFQNPLRILGFLPSVEDLGKPSMRVLQGLFPAAKVIGKIEEQAWTVPCLRTRIISLAAEVLKIEKYLKPSDLVVIGSGSERRIKNIIEYNKQMTGSIGGLIITCGDASPVSDSLEKDILAAGIPTLFVSDDTATAEQRVLKSFENTKIQPYDAKKMREIEEMFEIYFDMDKFLDMYPELKQ